MRLVTENRALRDKLARYETAKNKAGKSYFTALSPEQKEFWSKVPKKSKGGLIEKIQQLNKWCKENNPKEGRAKEIVFPSSLKEEVGDEARGVLRSYFYDGVNDAYKIDGTVLSFEKQSTSREAAKDKVLSYMWGKDIHDELTKPVGRSPEQGP